ncbi:hypothetical protein BH09PLA1_BH09PLA1_25980 [soil metagenome]
MAEDLLALAACAFFAWAFVYLGFIEPRLVEQQQPGFDVITPPAPAPGACSNEVVADASVAARPKT